MGRPRNEIVYNQALVHLTCRCHNQSFYLADDEVKDDFIELWRKYKDKYGIKIIEFVVMDNHIHLFVYVPNQFALSSFMQVTNSKIAMQINRDLNKKNQVFADRFRSPTIEDSSYFEKVIQYIWNNPVMAKMVDAENIDKYRYCSLYYRLKGDDCKGLLSSYEEIAKLSPSIVPSIPEGQLAYVKTLLGQLIDVVCNNVKNILANLLKNGKIIFEHLHTIGTVSQIKARRPLLFHKFPPSLAPP
jgi:REP element-mobilizing transposase RayT